MNLDYQSIGQRIRYFRKENRITQEELAFRIESSAAYVSNIEAGKKKPSLQKLTRIAEVLDITINDLIYLPAVNSSSLDTDEINKLISRCPLEKQQLLLQSISALLQTIITY